MDKLIAAKLFGAELMPVNSPSLVARYNACLRHMGIPETKLTEFTVDQIGWSPEVALEQNNLIYLTAGISNHLGIILSPEQARLPVYFPTWSFQRDLLGRYYEYAYREILDITTGSGICLDLDLGFTYFQSVEDLLMVHSIGVVSSTPDNLEEQYRRQRKMVLDFEGSESLWMETRARAELIENAAEYGDLRRRRVVINPFYDNDLDNFFTIDFGGVFVFRNKNGSDEPTMVFLQEHRVGEVGRRVKAFHIKQSMVNHLLNQGIVTLDLNLYRENPQLIEDMRSALAVEVLSEEDPTLEVDQLSPTAFKGLVHRHRAKMPALYFELEKTAYQLNMDTGVPVKLSEEVMNLLVSPATGDERLHQLAGMLLSYQDYRDPLWLYQYNKSLFYACYAQWSVGRQRWAVDRIEQRLVEGGF